MNIEIEKSWKNALKDYFEKDEWKSLTDFVRNEYLMKTVFPEPENVFKAFELTKFDDAKVIILGQDPYHNPNQAHGLSFSVLENIVPPPSLKNIYKEIENDLNITKDFSNGNLRAWAEQGVLLLNSILTVIKNQPASHHKKGWEEFTDFVIKKISDEKENCVFILWGNYAKSKEILINNSKHLVLKASHPSPFSAHNGFFGCKHFSKTNKYLKEKKKRKINW